MTDVKTAELAALFLPETLSDEPLAASLQRLLAADYEVQPVIHESVESDWPGDVAGRLLLSLTRLWRSGYPTEERAHELFAAILEAVNSQGYFGPELGDVVDEQQLACQGWVVSGLLQYFHITGDPVARSAALRIVDNLMLPALTRLDSYPRDRRVEEAGAPSGTLMVGADGWMLSSDTWCVLLAFNGLVPAFIVTGRADIGDAIGRLRDVLASIDVKEQRAQLHAVLAAARNLAQLAEETADSAAEALASRLYDEYTDHARTLNFATWNWFERPDSWTEPCAITDSVGLALALWRLTGDDRYLVDVEMIELNALSFAQRSDGSFGLDSVATDQHPVLTPIHPDARWCCTMRGAIGLLEARDGSVHYDAEDGTLTVLVVRPGMIRVSTNMGEWCVQAEADAGPGHWTFTVRQAPPSGQLALIVRSPIGAEVHVREPRNANGGRAAWLPAEVGFRVTAEVKCLPWESRSLTTGYLSYFSGPLLLGAPAHVEREADDGTVVREALRPVGALPNGIPPTGEAPKYRVAFPG